MVRDVLVGRAEHEIEIRWHFAPDLSVRGVGAGRVEITGTDAATGEAGLSLIVPKETVWDTATEVTRTLISPAYGAVEPAPLVRSSARVLLPAATATVLVPRCSSLRREDEAISEHLEPRLASMEQAAVQVYELDYHDESQGFFFALGDEGWSFGPWASDARVLYCRVEKEELAQLVVIGGSAVSWQGQPLLKAAGASAFFEWRKQDGVMNTESGYSVTPLFEKLTGGLSSSAANLDRTLSDRDPSNQGPSNRRSSSYAEKH